MTKKEVAKLDTELFARAPREAMQHAMTTIRCGSSITS